MNPNARAPRPELRPRDNLPPYPGIPTPPLTPIPGLGSDRPFVLHNDSSRPAVVVVEFIDEVTNKPILSYSPGRLAPRARLRLDPRTLKALPLNQRHRIALLANQLVTVEPD